MAFAVNHSAIAQNIYMNRKNTVICALMLIIVFVASQLAVLCKFGGINIALANGQEKCIYLTFDDGPSDRVTPLILDVLKEENVKATFFIVGKHAERRKYIIKREFNEGHRIGVHSYSHVYNSIYSSPEALLADIDKCNDIIEEITGKRSELYRFPGGSFSVKADLIATILQHGMRYVDWNASTCDAEIVHPTAQALYKAAINTPANRERIILLSHDTTDKIVTAQALRSIISYYKNAGYVFKRF